MLYLIRKYLGEHHSDLNTDGDPFKKAIEGGIAKKQLDRISGNHQYIRLKELSGHDVLYVTLYSLQWPCRDCVMVLLYQLIASIGKINS